MSTNKYFDKIAIALICLAIVASVVMAMFWVPNADDSGAIKPSKNDITKVSATLNLDTYDGNVEITTGGTYKLKGTLKDGQVVVDVSKKEKVILILDGVNINCKEDSAILVKDSGSMLLYLADGSENVITSGKSSSKASSDAEGGAILFKDDATISGNGKLTVNGYINNGIQCSNTLYVESGEIDIDAVNNGIKGTDLLIVDGGDITISAGNAGLKSGKSGDSNSGEIIINNGVVNVEKSYEGVEAHTITINDGDLRIVASDDGLNASGGGNNFGAGMGGFGMKGQNGQTFDRGQMVQDRNQMSQNLDSNQVPQDFGMNQMPQGTSREQMPQASEVTDVSLPSLTINGGKIHIIASGDGLDSNGDLTINGGLVLVDGPRNSGNGALDSGTENGGAIRVNGGTLLAIGASGMAETPGNESKQCSFSVTASFNVGSTIEILDANGKVLVSHKTETSGNSIVFSDKTLKIGETYTVKVDGTSQTVTQSELVTNLGSNSGGFGGGGMRNPNRGQGEFQMPDRNQENWNFPTEPEEGSFQKPNRGQGFERPDGSNPFGGFGEKM